MGCGTFLNYKLGRKWKNLQRRNSLGESKGKWEKKYIGSWMKNIFHIRCSLQLCPIIESSNMRSKNCLCIKHCFTFQKFLFIFPHNIKTGLFYVTYHRPEYLCILITIHQVCVILFVNLKTNPDSAGIILTTTHVLLWQILKDLQIS